MLPKISDFGLAKLFDTDKSSQGTTSRIAGTKLGDYHHISLNKQLSDKGNKRLELNSLFLILCYAVAILHQNASCTDVSQQNQMSSALV